MKRKTAIKKLAKKLGITKKGLLHLLTPCRLVRRNHPGSTPSWTCNTHSRVTYDEAGCKDGKRLGASAITIK